MNICFVCNEYPPSVAGGIGTFTRSCAQAMVQRGHEVRVIGIYPVWDREESFALDGEVHVHRISQGHDRLSFLRTRYRLYQRVAAWARKGVIDLVDVPDFGGPAAYWPPLPVPVIAHLHGSASYYASEMGRKVPYAEYRFERASLGRADFCCSTSQYTARRTAEIFRLRNLQAEVIFNPVSVQKVYRGGPRSGQSIVYTGTLTPKKGIVQLIRAWPAVIALCPNARLEVYGKDGAAEGGGSMRAYLQSLLAPEISGSVVFHGHVSHDAVITALRSCRAAVFPSYSEAFGLAPMEAMAQGCPTIYTTRASGPELVEDGVDGLLVDPDDIPGISAALIRLLVEDDFAKQLGYAGWRRVQEGFRSDQFAARLAGLFHRCVNSWNSASSRRNSIEAA